MSFRGVDDEEADLMVENQFLVYSDQSKRIKLFGMVYFVFYVLPFLVVKKATFFQSPKCIFWVPKICFSFFLSLWNQNIPITINSSGSSSTNGHYNPLRGIVNWTTLKYINLKALKLIISATYCEIVMFALWFLIPVWNLWCFPQVHKSMHM